MVEISRKICEWDLDDHYSHSSLRLPWLMLCKLTSLFFRRKMHGVEVCNETKSKTAFDLFKRNRYKVPSSCQNSCSSLNIMSILKSKFIDVEAKQSISLKYPRKIHVNTERLLVSSIQLVAEVGGYLGLTLGISLLDMYRLILKCGKKSH